MELNINYRFEYPVSKFFWDSKLPDKYKQTPIRIGSEKLGVVFPKELTYAHIKKYKLNDDCITITHKSGEETIPLQGMIIQPATVLNIIKDRLGNILDFYKNIPTISDKPGTYILLSGLPGSGKSSTAKYLSKNSGFLHIDFAKIAHYLFDAWIHFEKNYAEAGEIVARLFNSLLSKGYSVIHDTTSITSRMTKFHLSRIKDVYKKIVLVFEIEPEICWRRIISERPLRSPDSRLGLHRINNKFVLTFSDYVDLPSPDSYPLEKLRITKSTDVSEIVQCLRTLTSDD